MKTRKVLWKLLKLAAAGVALYMLKKQSQTATS
jgi:hypothetical protein